MNNSLAVAAVVLLEMCRRKDIYVLFILTVLITGLMGSVTFFDDARIVRYLKEICLALIWLASLLIVIAFHDWPMIAWSIWSIAIIYALLYAGMLVLVSWLTFRRQSIQ